MKRIALYIWMIGTLVAFCSVKEEYNIASVQEKDVFYASFEQSTEGGTRVYANEDLLLRWTTDDRVSIFNKFTINQQYKFMGDTGDRSGGFNKIGSDDYEFVVGNVLPHIVSVYPYQKSTEISKDEELSVVLPAKQAYANNTFGLGANTMVSVSSDNVLQYKNVGGYLIISLYGEGVTVSSITLKGNNGEKLAGSATITMPLNGLPSVVMASDASTEICMNPYVSLKSTVENKTDFWFVIPPTTFKKGFTITVKDSKGKTHEKSTSKMISVERNMITRMSPFEIISPVYKAPINIDGQFSDWDNLDQSKIAATRTNPSAIHTALTLARVYADSKSVFVYFEWDKNQIAHERDVEHVPFHCYINTDGDFSTGGFADEFSDACSELMFEGFIYPNGTYVGSYKPAIYEWVGDTNGFGWNWNQLGESFGFVSGAGVEGKYELLIAREYMPKKLADNFSIGFDIDQDWCAVGILPNYAPSESNPKGLAPSLQVRTVKD